ncbi:MAG: DUF3108 domain-containing protein [Bacteroidota bacterium]|nr:DUF3108 domain-containing protein [Bacteroidota bacterium]
MRHILSLTLVVVLFLSTAFTSATYNNSLQQTFQEGEWFKFRIHYGIFNASYAELEVIDSQLEGKDVYHIKGHGRSTGLLDLFFTVDDHYESYIDKNEVKPYRFIRDINEGGYKKDIVIDFDHEKNEALVHDKKRNTKSTEKIKPGTQDMVSAFYHLRDQIDTKTLKRGDEFILPMFFDKENYDFKLKFLKRTTVKTKFGKVPALKFKPYVQSGRVFKEQESLTVWISDDENKIPLRIKAKLAVGSLTADLEAFKGLKHSFKIIP